MTTNAQPAPIPATVEPMPMVAVVLLGLMTLFWGVNFPVMKMALREIEPWSFRVLCLTAGALGLFLIAVLTGQRLAAPRRDWPMLVVLSLLNITGWHLFSAFGISLMAAGRASVLAYTMPLWAVLAASPILGERLTRTRMAGLALGLGGIAVLFSDELSRVGAAPAGALCTLGSAISWGLGTAVLKSRRWGMGAVVLTGWQMVIGGLPVLAGFAFVGHAPDLAQVSSTAWLALAYAATVPMVFCHYAWTRLVGLLPAGVAAISTLMIPVVGVISSAPLVGEAVGLREIAALALVVAALVVVLVLPAWRRAPAVPAGGRAG
ncbi:MAG: DMT family transporter [Alphaproteobacteria bacterium]|nr:DMT family transporter [Alphaproteobacteria bacterium]